MSLAFHPELAIGCPVEYGGRSASIAERALRLPRELRGVSA